eukprot:1884688-Prymnesium_polylepis.1
MFGTEGSGYGTISWSPRVGVYQALREINNKSDGVEDYLLPRTQLRIAYADPKCDSYTGLMGALYLTGDAFDGRGVSAIIGAGCSGATTSAAPIAGGSRVPIISPSSSSPGLSDGRVYPYLLRTVPSDGFGMVAMVDCLIMLFNYSVVSLVHSTDAYGTGAANAFMQQASISRLSIVTKQFFQKDASDFSQQQHELVRAGSRVIVLVCQVSDGQRFLSTASQEHGIGGAGYLFFGLNSLISTVCTRGYFWILANHESSGFERQQAYLSHQEQLRVAARDPTTCLMETDDNGHYLWAQDHDNNASTPLQCAGDDPERTTSYDAFGYDAAYAVAHALHEL